MTGITAYLSAAMGLVTCALAMYAIHDSRVRLATAMELLDKARQTKDDADATHQSSLNIWRKLSEPAQHFPELDARHVLNAVYAKLIEVDNLSRETRLHFDTHAMRWEVLPQGKTTWTTAGSLPEALSLADPSRRILDDTLLIDGFPATEGPMQ